MHTRRSTIAGVLSVPFLARSTLAQEASNGENLELDIPPELAGRPDFAQAWSLEPGSTASPLAAVPELEPGYAELFSSFVFKSSSDITDHFRSKTGFGFIDWFNAILASKGDWVRNKIAAIDASKNFNLFWTSYLSAQSCTLLEFIAYMCVFINECNGNLVSQSELFGSKSHPGISYLYDRFKIVTPDRTFWKASYNTGFNKPAGVLFNDKTFNDAHGNLPSASKLMNTDDPVWMSSNYPSDKLITQPDNDVIGYVLAADFFKFRGRGLIQTTWRSNYLGLASFVKSYTGANLTIQSYSGKWNSISADEVCSRSNSADWDTLFAFTDSIILCEAIRQHAQVHKYLHLAKSTDVINGDGQGSLIFMGDRIGGAGYGDLLKRRVRGLCRALGQ